MATVEKAKKISIDMFGVCALYLMYIMEIQQPKTPASCLSARRPWSCESARERSVLQYRVWSGRLDVVVEPSRFRLREKPVL